MSEELERRIHGAIYEALRIVETTDLTECQRAALEFAARRAEELRELLSRLAQEE